MIAEDTESHQFSVKKSKIAIAFFVKCNFDVYAIDAQREVSAFRLMKK